MHVASVQYAHQVLRRSARSETATVQHVLFPGMPAFARGRLGNLRMRRLNDLSRICFVLRC